MSTTRAVGHYEIRELLGEGGIGQVHAAYDTMLDREVAIKSLRPELVNDKSFVDRFRSEANNLAKLTHPNITTLYSLLPEGGNLYMVMELVRGRTLEAILKEKGGPFSTQEALAVIGQAAEGLSYAHSMGIVHRDIKPANMMVTNAGLLKIMDFGIARVQGSQRMTRAGSAFGTPEYMSPEQVRGQDVDARSDLYSLAIVLYEMLTGAVPFSANTDYDLGQLHINATPDRPSRRISNIDPTVEKALMRALAKKASDRFDTVADFKAALGATKSTSEAASVVQKATRFMGALPNALASPAMSTVSSAVSSVTSAVGERVDKSAIPFALKGVAVGTGAAIVVAAAVILLWKPTPAPVTHAQTPPIAQTSKTSVSTTQQTSQPCGVIQDGMFYKPCPPSGSVASQQNERATGTQNLASPPTGPGGPKRPPFDAAAGPAVASPAVKPSQPVNQATATRPASTPSANTAVTPAVAAPVVAAPVIAPPATAAPAIAAPATAPPANPGQPAEQTAGSAPASNPPASESAAGRTVPPESVAPPKPPAQMAMRSLTPPAPGPGQTANPPPADNNAAGNTSPGSDTNANAPAAGPADTAADGTGPQANSAAPTNSPATAEAAPGPATPSVQSAARQPIESKSAEREAMAAYEARNYAIALELAEPCARDSAECQFILGRLYDTGNAGKKDPTAAADWYRKAAENKLAKAQYNLGALYLTGTGVLKDARTAAEWFYKAAAQGHSGAQFNLAMMYERGEGVERDTKEALKWYGEAAKSSDTDLAQDAQAAIEKLDRHPKRRRR